MRSKATITVLTLALAAAFGGFAAIALQQSLQAPSMGAAAGWT